MKRCLILILVMVISGSVLANHLYPTEIPNKYISPSVSSETEMKYHGKPSYYWTM
jgi:hypothetical protein